MIHSKYQHALFAFFMALPMSCFMSPVSSIFNVELVDNIVQHLAARLGVCFRGGVPRGDGGGATGQASGGAGGSSR